MNEETLLEEVGGNLLEENGNNAEAGKDRRHLVERRPVSAFFSRF